MIDTPPPSEPEGDETWLNGCDPNEADSIESKPMFAMAWSENQTEVEAARRFAREHCNRVVYCHPWKSWLVWTGTHWQRDTSGSVVTLAKQTADAILREAIETSERSAINYGVKMASKRGIEAMLNLAQSEVPIDHKQFDCDPFLLNCPNGTIDLRTGDLKPHSRDDYLTKICPTNYNPDAESFVWDRFLEDVFVSSSMIEFVQRLTGYCATGDVREQILPIFWGGGSNGKSTFLEAVMATLGDDYSGSAPKDLLLAKKSDSHPCDVADLFRQRLVVSMETEDNRRLAESLVKQLTGGDTIKARRMKENFWQFRPTHKLVLCSNHRPAVRGTDHAIWRRLKLVPFTERFEGERKDKAMPVKLRKQCEGILAWIVRGCLNWQRNGLNEPEAVLTATDEYRSREDIIGSFVAEHCLTIGAVEVRAKHFREALSEWCEAEGVNPPRQKAIADWMEQNGHGKRTSNGTIYTGIGLKEE